MPVRMRRLCSDALPARPPRLQASGWRAAELCELQRRPPWRRRVRVCPASSSPRFTSRWARKPG